MALDKIIRIETYRLTDDYSENWSGGEIILFTKFRLKFEIRTEDLDEYGWDTY